MWTAFSERFARYGFDPHAMMPVYGLAECSVGLTFPPPGRGPRIDRIDRNRTKGEWAVLDYKTGLSVNPPEKAHRKGSGKDREWIDLQLPLYRRLLSGIVDGEGKSVIDIDLEGPGQSRVRFGFVSLPQKVEGTEFMIAEWTPEDLASAEDAARDAVRRLRRASFEYNPDVTKATGFERDVLGPLLSVGWQASGDPDEAASGGQHDAASGYAEDESDQ